MTVDQDKWLKSAEVLTEWVADAAAQSESDAYLGKRQTLRYVWPAAIEAVIKPGAPGERKIYVTGRDVSEGGIGLLTRHDVPIGTPIWLRYADDGDKCPWVPGKIVHSTRTVAGYRLGVQFDVEPVE
jgi:hypothetical protein